MDERKVLFIKDVNGDERTAELLTILQIDGIEYAVYSMDKDVNFSDVYVARIIKDLNGNDNIVTIDNKEERNKIFKIVDKMISEG